MSMRHSARISRRSIAAATAATALVGLLGWRIVLSSRPPRLVLPEVVLPEPNGYDLLVEAGRLYVPVLPPPGPHRRSRGPTALPPAMDERAEELTAFLELKRQEAEANQAAYAMVRRAFALPMARPYHRPSDPRPGWVPLVKSLAFAEAHARAADEDWPRAAGAALDAMEMGFRLEHGYASTLSSAHAEQCGATTLIAILTQLDAGTARDAAKRLERLLARRQPFAQQWLSAWHSMRDQMEHDLGDPDWRRRTLRVPTPPAYSRHPEPSLLTAFVQTNFTSKRGYVEAHQRFIDTAALVATEPYRPERPPIDFALVSQRALISSWFESPYGVYVHACARDAQLLAALAIRAYQLEHGQRPATLGSLVPEYLVSLPQDPFTDGRPIGYRAGGEGFGVYSVGPDGHDDGGRPAARVSPLLGPERAWEDVTGDYVLGVTK